MAGTTLEDKSVTHRARTIIARQLRSDMDGRIRGSLFLITAHAVNINPVDNIPVQRVPPCLPVLFVPTGSQEACILDRGIQGDLRRWMQEPTYLLKVSKCSTELHRNLLSI